VLRFITYLAPSLPEALFASVAQHVGDAVGDDVTLVVEPSVSGPAADGSDPFTAGEADVGFMCAPSFVALSAMAAPPVVPLAAPVFREHEHDGQAVYWSEVVVRASDPATDLADLDGAVWGYNDAASLSGYRSLPGWVDLSAAVHTGSHLRSLEMLEAGAIDAAAIDSVVLDLRRRTDPQGAAGLKVVARLGPFPIQPVVGASAMAGALRDAVRRALLAVHLPEFGLERMVPITAADYARIGA
jgi:phosphonate transport system substrate-binding protein